MKYSEILEANRKLGNSLTESAYPISVLSNVVVSPLKEVLEYNLRSEGINARVTLGSYDNILQDSAGLPDSNALIVFWELAAIVDGAHYRVNLMNQDELLALESRVRRELDLFFANASKARLVIFNRFSALVFTHHEIRPSKLTLLADNLNRHLADTVPSNTILVDLNRLLAQVSIGRAVDFRFFYSSKLLYSLDFFKAYAGFVTPCICSAQGKAKKVLIFDCDNTLWKGVLGEDGPNGLEMSPATPDGSIFREVQAIALDLARQGVVLGLCTRNNLGDIEELLQSHPDMAVRPSDLATIRANWDDKASNLRALSEELNLALESFVFVDDSPFELDYVRRCLPEVTCVQVPELLHEYPALVRGLSALFFNLSLSSEDSRRAEQYRQERLRQGDRARFSNLTEYLRSLGIKLHVEIDNEALIPRVAQLSQKTNQFNLTTRRYTEPEIEALVRGQNSTVFALHAADRYGEYGVTGLAIVTYQEPAVARIDLFLLSCRIIGRSIEYGFFDALIEPLLRRGILELKASYSQTPRNGPVSGFWEGLGFELTEEHGDTKSYRLELQRYNPRKLDYLEVSFG